MIFCPHRCYIKHVTFTCNLKIFILCPISMQNIIMCVLPVPSIAATMYTSQPKILDYFLCKVSFLHTEKKVYI
jgi:hypothetical protein